MIIFLLINSITILSSFLIVSRLLKLTNLIDFLISWFIFYFTQIIFTELLLGILGILYLKNIILINLIALSFALLITKNKPSSFIFGGIRESISGLLKNKIILFGISLILGFALVKICINLINPPFGWDCLNYHFVFPVEWLKHGNLDIPITISDDPSPSYYPINGSLFFLWLILPFKNVFIADLGQIPFFLLGFLAIYSLGRKINLNREYCFLASCLFTLIPNYFKQMEIAYVDVMVSSLFFVSLSYLFLLNKRFSWRNILLFSMSLGLLLGTKTVALPYSGLLLLPFIYLVCKNINKSYLFIISIFIIATFGGFSYIRNFIETNNPLYPLNLKLLGKTILKGVMDAGVYGAHFRPEDYHLSKLLFHEGLGAQTLLFILPSIFLGLPIAIVKKRKSLNIIFAYFLILPILIYIVYRYIIPLANIRYLYPLLGIGIISGFYIAEILNIPRRIFRILVLICLLASMSELASHWELAASFILTCILLFLLPLLIKNIQKAKIIKPKVLIISIVTSVIILTFLEMDYIKHEYPRYIDMQDYSGFWPDATRAWNWLNENTQGNNIAYIGRPVPFPLYGTNFKNDVYYVSVNKTEPAKLHYFPNSYYRWGYDFLSLHNNLKAKGNYRSDYSYSVWLNNLLNRSTDYLFIYSLHQTKRIEFPLEDRWAKAGPDRFTPVFMNKTVHIYKIVK